MRISKCHKAARSQGLKGGSPTADPEDRLKTAPWQSGNNTIGQGKMLLLKKAGSILDRVLQDSQIRESLAEDFHHTGLDSMAKKRHPVVYGAKFLGKRTRARSILTITELSATWARRTIPEPPRAARHDCPHLMRRQKYSLKKRILFSGFWGDNFSWQPDS